MPNDTPTPRAALPSDDVIRAMDGPALCRLAWELGLAPDGYAYDTSGDSDIDPRWPVTIVQGLGFRTVTHWCPLKSLTQARAVFFEGLRARGWSLRTYSGEACGYVEAYHVYGDLHVDWGGPGEPTEPHALLLVSVLAVASEQRQEAMHA